MPMGDMIGTNAFEEVSFNIPNSNVLEANISATSSLPIELKLTDPKGVEQTIPSSLITVHNSKTYQLLKIKKPLQGDWKLYVKGVKGDTIGIDLVYNYELQVTVSPLSKASYAVGDELDIEAFLSLNGEKVDDVKLYSNAKASIILKDTLANNETKVKMDNTGKSFKASYKLKEASEYTIKVGVEDVSFNKESAEIAFKVEQKAVKTNNTLGTEVKEEETKSNKLGYILGTLLACLAFAALFIGYKVFKKTQIPLVGQLVIEIKDNITGKMQPPQYKKLHLFKGKVSLHALLQYAPELKAVEKIILKSAPGDKVYLYNDSDYVIEKAGRALPAKEGLELRKKDRLSINIADSGQTVQLEYLL